MVNDLYKDQLMLNHPSRDWSKVVLKTVSQVLDHNKWKINSTNRKDHATYTKNNRTLEINFCHNPVKEDQRDYYITDGVVNSLDWKTIILAPEYFGVYHYNFNYVNSKPTKKFNCFINRGCEFRQSWMYQFVRRSLLDHGNISYWCENRLGTLSASEHFEMLLIGNEIFKDEHQQLQGKIPYKNFTSSIEDAILDSERTVILETFFDDPDANVFTEKIWRSIQLPRPWLLLSSVGSVSCLRDWGFDVFDDYIDHSYDQEPLNFKRQTMILDQLSAPIDYTDAVLEDFEQRAQRNQQLLLKLRLAWPDKFKQALEEIAVLEIT